MIALMSCFLAVRCVYSFFSGNSDLGIFLDAPKNDYTGYCVGKSIRNKANRDLIKQLTL